ncbi:MAG: hypothetical protein R2719_12525 [Micropruina sp.]
MERDHGVIAPAAVPDRLLGRGELGVPVFGWGTISPGTALGGLLVSAAEPLLGAGSGRYGRRCARRRVHLALLPYAIPRVGTPQIRAAETAAKAETG